MTETLTQSQADLPRLVEIANQGEDVVITAAGQPRARLTRAGSVVRAGQLSREQAEQWQAELAELRRSVGTGKLTPTAEELIGEDRGGTD